MLLSMLEKNCATTALMDCGSVTYGSVCHARFRTSSGIRGSSGAGRGVETCDLEWSMGRDTAGDGSPWEM